VGELGEAALSGDGYAIKRYRVFRQSLSVLVPYRQPLSGLPVVDAGLGSVRKTERASRSRIVS
jgi:hypothetical protein